MTVTRRKKKAGSVPAESSVLDAGAAILPSTTRPLMIDPGVAWGNVIRDTLRIGNPVELAKRLRAELTMSEEERTSYASILQALDKSAKNYDDAYLLYRAAKVEEVSFGHDVRERLEIMKASALEELMSEYREKKRKSPTNDEIEDRMLVNWPDEYRHIKRKEAEVHAAMRSLETLSKAWASRCADLRVMADMFARKRNG